MTEYEWQVFERPGPDELCVASGTAGHEDDARKEAAHYLMMYSQDGLAEARIYRCERELIEAFARGLNK